jgi:hypothetical protein
MYKRGEGWLKYIRAFASSFLACCFCIVLFVRPAHAYIDPNAAGLLSQIITPLLVAAAAAFTFFRRQIANLFSGISRRFRGRADV